MKTTEKVFGCVPGINSKNSLWYNLYITSNQLIQTHVHDGSSNDLSSFGQVGLLIEGIINSQKGAKIKESLQNLKMDYLMADSEIGLRFKYDDILQVKLLNTRSIEGSPKFEFKWVNPLDNPEKKESTWTYYPSKEQFEALSNILPSVDELKNKLIIEK